jgi:hypothetical protein
MMAPVNEGGEVLQEISLISGVFVASKDGLILFHGAV